MNCSFKLIFLTNIFPLHHHHGMARRRKNNRTALKSELRRMQTNPSLVQGASFSVSVVPRSVGCHVGGPLSEKPHGEWSPDHTVCALLSPWISMALTSFGVFISIHLHSFTEWAKIFRSFLPSRAVKSQWWGKRRVSPSPGRAVQHAPPTCKCCSSAFVLQGGTKIQKGLQKPLKEITECKFPTA